MQIFRVSDYITLKLEDNTTNIYINEELFRQCKALLLNITYDEVLSLDHIDSIDKAADTLNRSLEFNKEDIPYIPPEVEFWGHCSNLQVWYENNYNTRLLHSNLAFPLLRKLVEVGAPKAKIILKEEIIKRFLSYELNVIQFLIEEGYVKYFEDHELKELIERMSKDIEKFPLRKSFLYLKTLASGGIQIDKINRIIKILGNKLSSYSREQALDFLTTIFKHGFTSSYLNEAMLEDANFSRLFCDSLMSNHYILQNKAINLLSNFGAIGINFLIRLIPSVIKNFNSFNFKTLLFESRHYHVSIDPSSEMINFIVDQLSLKDDNPLDYYNKVMEILDGLKLIFEVSLSRDLLEISPDIFYSKFKEYYAKFNFEYDFCGIDSISQFRTYLKNSNYYYDFVQERLPVEEFFRGHNDAHRELKNIFFPEDDLIIFHLAEGWEDNPSLFEVINLDLGRKAKKWFAYNKRKLEKSSQSNFQKILVNALHQLLIDDFNNKVKLKILYYILDYIIYERRTIEARYIDFHIFNEQIESYFQHQNYSVIFNHSKNCEISYTIYPIKKHICYNSKTNHKQILQLFKDIFFPDENLEILKVFKLKNFVFYVHLS